MSQKHQQLVRLGAAIRAKRLKLGLSQEALADAAEVDRSYMGGVERGERNITFLVLCRIARALEAKVSDLTGGLES